MHHARKLTDSLYLVGGNDRRLERFENLFPLPEGVSYNAYLMLDEKTCLFDGIDKSVGELYFENIAAVLDGRKLDYFVVNHVEPDHCQTIHGVLLRYPEVTLLTSQKALTFLEQFYPYDFTSRAKVMGEGDFVSLGQHEIEFITAANVHWPEVTMVYEKTEGMLFSADAFGSFKTPDGHIYADEVDYERDWMAEFRRYYVNIVGRFGRNVQMVLGKLADKPLNIILPLHGLIFRKGDLMNLAIDKYDKWSTYTPEEPGVVLVYSSLYENTMHVADHLAFLIAQEGVKNIRVYDVAKQDYSFVIADAFRFSNAVFLVNNYNTELYPKMDAFLRELRMLNWDNRKVSYVANGSWGGRGLKIAKEIIDTAKNIEQVGECLEFKSNLPDERNNELEALAKAIAESL